MADPLKELDRAARSDDPRVKYWQGELELAAKRRKDFRRNAERIVKLYEGERKQENSFNILYSNTETLLPACYNQLPRPFVDRRFKDADPLGKQAALAMERTLSALEDSGNAEYDSFDSLMEQAVLGALVPGEGLTRFRYDAKITNPETSLVDREGEGADGGEAKSSGDEESGEEGEGEELLPIPGPKVAYETICGQDLDYGDYLFGYARRWVDVPWAAFLHQMTEEDVEKNFGEELAGKLTYAKEDNSRWKDEEEGAEEGAERGSEPVVTVWEIWNKRTRKVEFYAPSYGEGMLKVLDDPYGLSGFFPCPEPLKMLLKRSKLVGTAPFVLYEQQAVELNRITRRINRIIEAMKVRGFYDGTMKGLQDLLMRDDNTFLAAKDVAALQDGKNLSNSIWMMPLKELQVVLHELINSREAIKQTIYEITGIADIMRGNSQASETATAQNIKNQWGTLKLKRMQRYVQGYVRACLRIVGELAGQHFSVETFDGITNLPYSLEAERQQAQQILQKVQMLMAQMPPQVNPQTGQQMPPQLPPQVMQAAQQAQQVLAMPKWEDVVGLLRNDLLRYYRIDIETNSTIAADTMEDKQDVTEAMTALANMFQSFGPIVQSGALPLPVLKAMTLSVARRFAFGREVEDAVGQMPDQLPPQGPDPKQVQQAMQQVQKAQQDLGQREQKLQQEQQQHELEKKQLTDQMGQQQASQQQAAKQAIEETKMIDKQIVMEIEQMLAKHMMAVDQKLMQSEGKQQMGMMKTQMQAQGAPKPADQAATKALVQAVASLQQAVEALVKISAAPREVTLQTDANGRPQSAVSKVTTLQ